MDNAKQKRITGYIDEGMHDEIKIECVRQHKKIRQFIAEALGAWLRNNKGQE